VRVAHDLYQNTIAVPVNSIDPASRRRFDGRRRLLQRCRNSKVSARTFSPIYLPLTGLSELVTERISKVRSLADQLSPRSIALINPLGDFGIDTYTHELARGLAANGHFVDVYAADSSCIPVSDLPGTYRRFAVLGSRLPTVLRNANQTQPHPGAGALSTKQKARSDAVAWAPWARHFFLAGELALHLKRSNYDFVWTQWPDLASYRAFWGAASLLRIPLVHTVHNIFPHERNEGDLKMCQRAYRAARVLFVHSVSVRDELALHFPAYAAKAVTMAHGTYTLYPRCPDARAILRAQLNIPDAAVVLFLPGVQRYKNVAACIDALSSLGRRDVFMVIAGRDRGAPENDPLRDTREQACAAGIESQVRLMPGYLETHAMSELFEAGDVLMLPYSKSYGSGLLMLGMTFGKYVIATRPGMEEAASRYPRAIMLDSTDPSEIARGVKVAIERVIADPAPLMHIAPEFDWRNIAASCIKDIRRFIPA
jgi:glycosyltransferase involved in cell wall biosynthesis